MCGWSQRTDNITQVPTVRVLCFAFKCAEAVINDASIRKTTCDRWQHRGIQSVRGPDSHFQDKVAFFIFPLILKYKLDWLLSNGWCSHPSTSPINVTSTIRTVTLLALQQFQACDWLMYTARFYAENSVFCPHSLLIYPSVSGAIIVISLIRSSPTKWRGWGWRGRAVRQDGQSHSHWLRLGLWRNNG